LTSDFVASFAPVIVCEPELSFIISTNSDSKGNKLTPHNPANVANISNRSVSNPDKRAQTAKCPIYTTGRILHNRSTWLGFLFTCEETKTITDIASEKRRALMSGLVERYHVVGETSPRRRGRMCADESWWR
jgi:hypothetical protein